MAAKGEFTEGFGIETDDDGVRWLIGRVRIEEGVKTQSGLDRYFS